MQILEHSDFPIPVGPLNNPGYWNPLGFVKDNTWRTEWSEQAIAELKNAVVTVKRTGPPAGHFKKKEFPLPTITHELKSILSDLETKRGFVVIQGLPIHEFDDEEIEILFWGLMTHLGEPMSQNAMGHLLGHVRDLGLDANDPKVRNYQTTAELFFHNDSCDVLMLLSRRSAKKGGQSRLASIPALFNAMWAEDPELTRELFRPFAVDRRGEPGRPDEGDEPFYTLPILNYYDGYLTGRIVPRSYIESAQRFAGVPPLTKRMNLALDFLERMATRSNVSFSFDMHPGDIQLVNNYCTCHSRTEFIDYNKPDKKRHMLRGWLSVSNSRPLPPWYKSRWGSVKPGEPRGGVYASRPTQ